MGVGEGEYILLFANRPYNAEGSIKLEITDGADKIRVRDINNVIIVDANNTSKTWPPTLFEEDSMPYNLWVEGVEASDGPRDVELTLSYIRGPGEDDVIHDDKVRFTVVEVGEIHIEYATDTWDIVNFNTTVPERTMITIDVFRKSAQYQ